MAYQSKADELLYGGSAGGGKTDLLLGLAGTAHWRSVILRREFPLLRDAIERSREIYNAGGASHAKDSYNESLHIWRMASGRIVEFGSLQHDKDRQNFQGRAHDLKGWDELTAFTEMQYRFVNAWNRSTRGGQRCRVVATSNPPTTTEGQWVVRYFAPWLDDQHTHPAKAGELRWFASIDGKDIERETNQPFTHKGETVRPKSRTFIPARLSDNPYLSQTDYATVLQNLPEPLRSQLLLGDWKAGVKTDPWQVIPADWARAAVERWKNASKPDIALTAIGADIARGGDDYTTIARRYGVWFAPLEKHTGSETPTGMAAAGLIIAALQQKAYANIDVIGIGASAYDFAQSQGANVRPVNFAEGTTGTDKSGRLKFRNVRAEAYWRLREALDPEFGDGLCLPDDPELIADLTAPKWSVTAGGILIEDKAAVHERLGRSPDAGDAVALAHYGAWLNPFKGI